MCPLLGRGAFFLLGTLTVLLRPLGVSAQEEVIPILRGEVRVADAPLSEGVVVLHQVSADASGEVDSVRVAPDGTFQLRLPHVPDHASRPDVFFASVEYRGLLYFGPAVTEAVQLDSLYLIQAFDTLSVPPGGADLPISARNLFLEQVADGWTATDVFEVHNGGDRTLFSPEDGVVWSYPLPPSASGFQLGQSDLAPETVRFTEGRMELFAPLPPGERFLMIRYQISEPDFLLPLPGRTDRLEVLVREPAPALELSPLVLSPPVELEPGNVFRRYSGEGLQDTEVRTRVAQEPWSLPAPWIALFMAGLLGAAGVVGYRKRTGATVSPAPPSSASSRTELLVSIASLDEDFHSRGDHSEGARREYEAKRAQLLAKLKHSA
jgi:hypothetical protein